MVLVIAFFLVSVFTGVWTDRLWFKSVGYSEVFSKVIGTKVLLFIVFGLLMAAAVGANVVLAYRFRPLFRPSSAEQVNLDRYREVVDPLRRWLVIGLAIVLGLFAGGSGSGQWRQYLLWRHGGSFGTTDATFHKDVGFYVFDLPWLHYLVDFAMAAAVLSLLAAAVVHYLFGGIRLQAKQDRLSGAAQVQISVLAGLFVLFKGADFWLDRYNLTSGSGGLFTGVTFTDQQRGAARQDDPHLHRDHLRGAVLRERAAPYLAAAVGGAGPAGAVLDPARRHLARHRPAVPGASPPSPPRRRPTSPTTSRRPGRPSGSRTPRSPSTTRS